MEADKRIKGWMDATGCSEEVATKAVHKYDSDMEDLEHDLKAISDRFVAGRMSELVSKFEEESEQIIKSVK